MNVTFYGAAREVTGSCHCLVSGEDHILLDCGMFQGKRKETEMKNRVLPIDPHTITNVVLSHAHIDHSGRLPLLTREGGFGGRIYCTRPTADACKYLLLDSAKIQEGDASFLNYRNAKHFLGKVKSGGAGDLTQAQVQEIRSVLKSNDYEVRDEVVLNLLQEQHLEIIQPLYSTQDATESLAYFSGVPFEEPITVGRDIEATFYTAGHILGSAFTVLSRVRDGERINVFYSGDVGRFNKPIINNPTLDFPPEHRKIDLMILESTYGDRFHEPVRDMKEKLREVIQETWERGGSVIIPAFSYGRTQELIYFLHALVLEDALPPMPIWVDSPLATKITRVFGEHPESYDEETHDLFLEKGINPFEFPQLKFVQSVQESMELNRDERPHIVIAGSGMCEGGRVLHHLRHKIHNERNTVLIVGYMGQGTFGRLLQERGDAYEKNGRKGEPPTVRFYNKEYPLRAHVRNLRGFSAHGDRNDLMRLLKDSHLEVKRIAIVHGEEEQSAAFAKYLNSEGFNTVIPRRGQCLEI